MTNVDDNPTTFCGERLKRTARNSQRNGRFWVQGTWNLPTNRRRSATPTMTRSRGIGGHIDEFDHAADLRTPRAFKARSITSFGLRSPLAVTLTIAFAIRSVIGSSGLVTPTSSKAAS